MLLYPFVKAIVRVYFKIMFKITVVGKENVPQDGNGVLCCNHISNYDPLTMAVYLDRLPRFIAKKELFGNKVFGAILRNLKAFPVDRQAAMDMKAFKTAVNVLKGGELLGIFAEGTRVKEGEEKAAKAGVAMFALKGEAPVIPVAISGEYKFRNEVRIEFGAPMTLEEYRGARITTSTMEEITEKIMGKVQEMKVEL
ncbi:lysophospholipid acyltransferase family protein [Anaerotignum sp. MB30-C6]|uniref:lysophospholipid acyltransferase family protein n=1 Tax=Anaerotignum sp. MB30-C6 TaxID=3070814 RepID=UPI0027DC6EFF|nr:lysophospholipid acyltransferase family protein [Anaerotignum sp. MB30-C6]WMI81676.1 lysophospholipid acyltransferase family protein [Anaerotignum sp. MB30-C6]